MDYTYIKQDLQQRLIEFYNKSRKLTVLTGAGLSADSGIPTFRGKDGIWTVGSVNYVPEDMGTFEMFTSHPLEVWKFFLYRFNICFPAVPNAGHYAIRELEDMFGERFQLITQNVNGLHFKAGSSRERAYCIHGTLEKVRCGSECSNDSYPYPNIPFVKGQELTEAEIELLKCPTCGNFLRPHVLWFDEMYNEKFYKLDSSLRVAKETGLLLIVGTSGATNLPRRIVESALQRGSTVIDINLNLDYFGKMIQTRKNGHIITGPTSEVLPELVTFFKEQQEFTK
jgi:NAD-dependent deacetylase